MGGLVVTISGLNSDWVWHAAKNLIYQNLKNRSGMTKKEGAHWNGKRYRWDAPTYVNEKCASTENSSGCNLTYSQSGDM